MDEKSKDIWLGISLFICCVLMYFVVIPFAVDVPKSVKIKSLSPAYWPKIITVTTAFLSLLILLSGIAEKKSNSAGCIVSQQAKGDGITSAQKRGLALYMRPAMIMITLVVYFLILEPLGIVTASMIGFLLFAVIFGEKKVKILLPITILLPISLYYFFVKVANIPLPLGMWERF